MDITTYSDVRQNLKSVMDKVCADHAAVAITRRGGEDVVMMSRRDYDAWQETLYLLRSPANAERLQAAMASDEAGSEYASADDFDDAFDL